MNKAEDRSLTTLIVDGQLSGRCIEVVETCCNQAMLAGKEVRLCLRDVSSVDRAGRALLRRLVAKGVRLLANGVYTSYLIRDLNPARTEKP